MKIYNKFVESKKEPYNKNDIWFDGEYIKLYKEGEWKAFTVPLGVKLNGDVCILGIGGYDGTNLNTAKSVQEVISELVNKLNEITTND